MIPNNCYVYKTPTKEKKEQFYNTMRNENNIFNKISDYVYLKNNIQQQNDNNSTGKKQHINNNLNFGNINNNGKIDIINNVNNNNIISNMTDSSGVTTYYPPDYGEFRLNNSAINHHPCYKRKPLDNKPIYNTDYIQYTYGNNLDKIPPAYSDSDVSINAEVPNIEFLEYFRPSNLYLYQLFHSGDRTNFDV